MRGIRIALSGPTFGAGLDDMCGLHEPGFREVVNFALSALLAGHGLLFPLSRSPQAGGAGYSSRNASLWRARQRKQEAMAVEQRTKREVGDLPQPRLM